MVADTKIVRLSVKDPKYDWKPISWDMVRQDIVRYIPGFYAKDPSGVIYIYQER